MMTNSEITRHDLENVCFHEAGHLVVLHKTGGLGFIRIDDLDDSDLMNRRAFAGRVCAYQSPPTKELNRVFSLAGYIAEIMHREPDYQEFEFIEADADGLVDLSDTDRQGANGYTEATVSMVFELLRKNWAMVEYYAMLEIAKQEVSEP